MGKVVRTVVKIVSVAAAVALAIPSGGTSLLAAGLGVSALAASGIVLGLAVAGTLLTPKAPKIPNAQRDRLYSTIDPGTPRKMALGGQTALANDIRYEEWSGSNQEYLDRIICVASHEVQSVDEIWIEDRQAWTLGGGVTSTFTGYLTVAVRTVGTSANTIAINGGGTWGSAQRLTGCAYIHLRFKTTGNTKTAESPFASSIPQRVTIVGNGAKLYDPRLDTTAGGSGSQRSNDQTTWTWTSTTGNNPALQILFYLLGWKIGGKLAIGRGIPPERIDMASFITAANLCEEAVALAAGGTEQRYRSYGVVSEADAPSAVLDTLLAACAGTLRDVGGQLSLSILHNDLASPVAAFTDDDVLGAFNWQPQKGLDESFNQIRGKRTDSSNNSLYQLVDYPPVTLTSPDGLERIHTFDLPMVQSASQAQRLAKQELQRAQYQGVFSAEFKATAWKAKVGDPVTQTFSALGFSAKLFRITSQTIRMDGVVNMELREENAAIYAWSAEETAAVTPAAPSVFDPLNSPLIQGISAAALTIRYPGAFPSDPPIGSLYFDSTAKQFRFEGTAVTSNGVAVTSNGVAVTDSGWVDVQDTAIAASATTANWSSIVNDNGLAPDNNADVTANQSVVSRLSTSSGQALSNFIGTDGRTFSRIADAGEARDGDIIVFSTPLPAIPRIMFLPGGNGATAGHNINIQAMGISVSGFTMKAKEQAVTVGSTITDTGATTGGGGEPSRVMNRTDSGSPFDGGFRFNYFVNVGDIGPGEPGYVTVGLYTKQSGSWVQVGENTHSYSGNFTTTAYASADFGAGNEFGISQIAAEGTGSTLGTFNSVAYTLGSVTETSLTPSGASPIPWLALLQ